MFLFTQIFTFATRCWFEDGCSTEKYL